jgi:hypothetical protein
MSVGLSAVLGERMSARGVGEQGAVTGLQAYYAMREGFAGRGQTTGEAGVFEETVAELISLARENGRTVEEQRFFLERMGMGFEGAKVLTTIASEQERTGNLQGAIEKNQKDLNNAFVDRAKETSGFQRALLRIQDGIAKIGAGLLGITVSGFQATVAAIKALMHSQLFGGDPVERKVAQEMMNMAGAAASQSTGLLIQGFKETFQGFEVGLNAITGGRKLFVDQEDIRKRIVGRERDIEAGRIQRLETRYSGVQDITATELQGVAAEAREEAMRVKRMGVMSLIRNQTDALRLGQLEGRDVLKELENIYRKEEIKPGGKGEEAVYRRMQALGIDKGVSLEQLKERERQSVESAYIDLGPGRGKAKLQVVIKAIGYDAPTGMAESR